jgi:hypothetical protein
MCVIPLPKTPGHKIARTIIPRVRREGKHLPAAAEKDHEVCYAAVVDVGVGGWDPSAGCTSPRPGIRSEVIRHVLVDFFLEVNADRAVGPDDFVGADAGGGKDSDGPPSRKG